MLLQTIPSFRVAAQCRISVPAHILYDPLSLQFDWTTALPTPGNALDHFDCFYSCSDPHYKTTLFSGYSTMPSAFACLSREITSQAAPSSITVLTASQYSSLKCEMVGFCSAGKTAKTAGKLPLRTFSMSPTRS